MKRTNSFALIGILGAVLCTGTATGQQLLFHFPLEDNGSSGNLQLYEKDAGATPSVVPGKLGSALNFEQAAALASPFNLDHAQYPQITVTAWVRENDGESGTRTIFSSGSSAGIRLGINGGRLAAKAGRTGVAFDAKFPRNEWVFVAAVVDTAAGWARLHQGDATYLRDGIDTRTAPPSTFRDPADPAAPEQPWVFVGANEFRTWAGTSRALSIDDVRVFNGALDQAQIEAIRTGGQTATTAPPVGADFDPARRPDQLVGQVPEDLTSPNLSPPAGAPDLRADVPLLDDPRQTSDGTVTPELTMPENLPGQELEADVSQATNTPPAREPGSETDTRELFTVDIVLPGDSEPTAVPYYVEDGEAVVDGDMVLGPADRIAEIWANESAREAGGSTSTSRTVRQPLNATTNLEALWPGGVIPYVLGDNLSPDERRDTLNAVRHINNLTNLQLVPHTDQRDYIRVFHDESIPGAGKADFGRMGGDQRVRLKNCSAMCVVHEFLHGAGITHEQCRADRDEYVDPIEENIESGREGNFSIKQNSRPMGPYDYGSIMHYSATAFSKDDCSGDDCITIRALKPLPAGVTMGQRNGLSDLDIAGINRMYPAGGLPFAENWAQGEKPVSIALGDIDGDGRDEIVVARTATSGARIVVYDSDGNKPSVISNNGSRWGGDWGSVAQATDVATGDIDGDGKDEIGFTRKAGTYSRFYILDDRDAGFEVLYQGGADWGDGNYGTAIAFGDADGDGRDEIAIGRRAGEYGRYYLFDDATASEPFKRMAIGGSDWGKDDYVTDLAFGNVDGTGRHELGVARRAGSAGRFYVMRYSNGRFVQLMRGGVSWGSDAYATAVAFGNVDGDAADEMIVGRTAPQYGRFYILDDAASQFAELGNGGEQWSSPYYPVGVAIGDVDKDSIGEIVLVRNAGENRRLYVYDDFTGPTERMNYREWSWPTSIIGSALGIGDVDADGDMDIVVGRGDAQSGQYRIDLIRPH